MSLGLLVAWGSVERGVDAVDQRLHPSVGTVDRGDRILGPIPKWSNARTQQVELVAGLP